MFRTRVLTGLAALIAAVALCPTARADEVATINNQTDVNVSLYLKWSNLSYESELITLAPGESYTVRGPDGKALYMRFNSTPTVAGPARERKVQLYTNRVPTDVGPGYVSFFRPSSPNIVGISDR